MTASTELTIRTSSRIARRVAPLLIAATTLLFTTPAGAIEPKKDWQALEFPEIELGHVEPHIEELGNGVRLFVLQNDRLPLVDISVMVRTGELFEPAGKAGLAELTGRVLRSGGTTNRSWRDLDREIDEMAVRFHTYIGAESGGAYMNTHSANLDRAVGILADVLRNPVFDDSKIEVALEQMREDIRRQNDNAVRIAMREGRALLYGKDHPGARYATFETLDTITRDDLVRFHQTYYKPNNIWIGMAGNVTPEEARRIVKEKFGDWKASRIEFPALPPRVEDDARSVTVYHAQKETQQSTVLVGHLSIRMDDPDRAKLQVGNFILGGSFSTSRLVERIRHKEGLAYYAGSWFDPAHNYDGVFSAVALTKGESTGKTLRIILEELQRIHDEPVDPEELETARNALVNREAFQYEDPENVVSRMVRLDYFGLPSDYYEQSLREYQRVTREELHAAMKRNIRPDELKVLVVGDESKFDIPLEDIGYEVHRIELEESDAN